ncbi:MAG: hypothetical protein M3Q83_02520 [Pseudomonadota bacterium]|nr:hypothetical protein [Pseudomonadota bacterium]
MADLFLDTDYLGIVGPEKVAERIRPAAYSRPELQAIFANEVLPAFAFNLFDIAGEWEGWHLDFVRERVLQVRSRRPYVARIQAALVRRSMLRNWSKIEQVV